MGSRLLHSIQYLFVGFAMCVFYLLLVSLSEHIGFDAAYAYGFLYMLLRLEDYALLAGSLGLFLVLALLMVATRRVNWYDLQLNDSGMNP